MSIEFFLELVVFFFVLAALTWLYCAVFDFVDEWRKKRDQAMLKEARLPPMGGRYGFTEHEPPDGPPDGWERRPAMPKARRMMD